ncbi:hypothetical protein KFE25_001971 [Diacronema lutheri]|uniref:Uncharacterized protein n=1 Tax=Diacronema lutheri TaxID=2081491 RepID=A0A8J5XQV3_DIALT|nr:hypothetical protein KFE25_001971 [Diacronema lutheri]
MFKLFEDMTGSAASTCSRSRAVPRVGDAIDRNAGHPPAFRRRDLLVPPAGDHDRLLRLRATGARVEVKPFELEQIRELAFAASQQCASGLLSGGWDTHADTCFQQAQQLSAISTCTQLSRQTAPQRCTAASERLLGWPSPLSSSAWAARSAQRTRSCSGSFLF